jgi:hypothetical protein
MTEAEQLADLIAELIEANRAEPGEPAAPAEVRVDLAPLAEMIAASDERTRALFGELLRMLAAPRPEPGPPVTVQIPPLQIDPTPLADAVAASGRANAEAVAGSVDVVAASLSGAIVEAAKNVPAVDIRPLVNGLAGIASVLAAGDAAERLGAVVEAIEANRAAVEANTRAVGQMAGKIAEQTAAIEQQNRILGLDRSVEYDADGRVRRVKIG